MRHLITLSVCIFLCTVNLFATNYLAEAEYYQKKAEGYRREAAYYEQKAKGYEREAEYYLKKAEGYQREAADYSKKGDIDRANTQTRYARNAMEKLRRSSDMLKMRGRTIGLNSAMLVKRTKKQPCISVGQHNNE